MRTSRMVVGAVAALASLVLAAPAAQAAPVNVLDLELNDPAGSAVAVDSSGMGHNGAVGSHIRLNGSYGTWDRHDPASTTYYGANHLIMIPDAADGSLDPGTGNFVVEFRYRTTVKFGNVIQKGQNKDAGGQVKFQQPGGYMSCMFKSPTGQAAIKATKPTNDGQWHVFRCERTPTQVSIYIDGVFNARIRHTTGDINNKKPWTIGGKFDCDTSLPTTGADSCDYWAGDMDWVHITKG